MPQLDEDDLGDDESPKKLTAEQQLKEVYHRLKFVMDETDRQRENEVVPAPVLVHKFEAAIRDCLDVITEDFEKEFSLFDDDEMPEIKVINNSFVSDL